MNLAEQGARNSAKDLAKLQEIHDHTMALGAKCSECSDGSDRDSMEAKVVLGSLLLSDLEEKGARNSQADQMRIQAMHDAAYYLGANCGSQAGDQDNSGTESRVAAQTEALRFFMEAGILRNADSHDELRSNLQKALINKYNTAADGSPYSYYGDGAYPAIRDVFPDSVVYQHQKKLKSAPYTKDSEGKISIGDEQEVEPAYVSKDRLAQSESLRLRVAEAGILRQEDSLDAKTCSIRRALNAKFGDSWGPSSVWIRDVFPDQVVYCIGSQCYAAPYSFTGDDDDADDTCVLGDPVKVCIAYVPEGSDEDAEEAREAIRKAGARIRTAPVSERKISQKDREKIPDEDFAGKNRSFFIVKPEDVKDAADSIGRAGDDNYDSKTLKANIIKIAKRKGADFEAQLPQSWKESRSDEEEEECPECGGSGKCPDCHGTGYLDESAGESLLATDLVPLREGAVSPTGQANLKVINPGWGSSGYYSKEVLKRDGPAIFKAGTKMFADHPTKEEETARPERSIKDLMATLAEDAHWEDQGPDGPGLYAKADVIEPWRGFVEQYAPHIGVSIRAMGRAAIGEAEGKRGTIIQSLAAAKSVDFVTTAGRGGKILPLYESFRQKAGQAAPGRTTQQEQSTNMTEQEKQEFQALQTKNAALETQVARLMERNLLSEAASYVNTELSTEGKPGFTLPQVTKKRLVESLAKNPPATADGSLDKAAFTTKIDEAVKEEAKYLSEAGAGAVRNLGVTTTQVEVPTDEKLNEALEETFRSLGLNESAAKVAARGR